jgi:hypothetical protein
MITIRSNCLTVTIITPRMELVIPVSLWADRNNRKNILAIARGE